VSAFSTLDSVKELFPCACATKVATAHPNTAKKNFNYFATFAVWEPCFLKIRVGENSPSLCPTMFSVTKTELKILPLWTRTVWPTNSGVIIERRDQVLIGFFEGAAFILSIFSNRWPSTNGPFFRERPIS